MDNNYCVYVHTFPNDKVYVGITCQKTKERWGYNGSGYKCQPVYKAIKQYVWDNIEHDVICENVSRETAQKKRKRID